MRFIISILFFIIYSSCNLFATEMIVSDSNSVLIKGNGLSLSIEFYKPHIAKFSYRITKDSLNNPSLAVIYSHDSVPFTTQEYPKYYTIESDSIRIDVLKNKLETIIIDKTTGNILIDTIRFGSPNNYRGFFFRIDSSLGLYGLGSHSLPIDRTGHSFTLYNANRFGYEYGVESLNTNIPFFIFGDKFAILADNHTKSYCGIRQDRLNFFNYYANSMNMDFYVINQKGHSNILKEYSELTGYQPLPPLWSFGYLQSNSGYSNSQYVKSIVSKMRAAQIPIDAIILDYLWLGNVHNLGNFEWDSTYWGNPTDFVGILKSHGIKTILISEPQFSVRSKNYKTCLDSGYFCKDKSDTVPIATALNAKCSLLDITNPKANKWFSSQYKNVTNRDNIDGWWCDLGEPEPHSTELIHYAGSAINYHNIFGFMWIKAVYDVLKETQPNKRPFILARSGWTGMQRFGAIPWSGDSKSSYSALTAQVPIILGMGLSGSAYMHSDIGGFWGFEKQNILYARWMQLGAFSPIMRPHSTGVVPTEPINYPDSIMNICKYYIKLRYSLLPYIYTLAYENSTQGSPICRAMNYYSNNPLFRNESEQYYFGRDLLVAPILDSTEIKNLIIPEGKWIDFYNLDVYEGIQRIRYNAKIDRLPLFVRAGALIPMINDIQSIDDYSTDTLTINYYFDSSIQESHASVFNDDGKNTNSLVSGNFEIINIKASNDNSKILIDINSNRHNWTSAPKSRIFKINVLSKSDKKYSVTQKSSDTDSLRLASNFNTSGGFSFTSSPISQSVSFAIDLQTGIGGINQSMPNEIKVVPNPAKDQIIIALPNKLDCSEFLINISDISGKTVINRQGLIDFRNQPTQCTVELIADNGTKISTGTYMARMSYCNKEYNFKFIVE